TLAPVTRQLACSISPCTVRSLGCTCHPRNSVPSNSIPSRSVSVRASEATEKPCGGARAPQDGGPLPETPCQVEPRAPGAPGHVPPRDEGVGERVADAKHRPEKGKEPGEEVASPPTETATHADAAGAERRHVLLGFTQGERKERRREPGAFGEEQKESRSRGRPKAHQPSGDAAERPPRGPAQ